MALMKLTHCQGNGYVVFEIIIYAKRIDYTYVDTKPLQTGGLCLWK